MRPGTAGWSTRRRIPHTRKRTNVLRLGNRGIVAARREPANMFSHSLRERHLPQPWRIHAARASASRRPLTTASDSLSVRFPVSRGASRSGEHLLSILVNEATGSVVAEGRRVRSGRAWSDSDEPQLRALPRGLRRPRPHCLFRCSATVGRPTRLGRTLTSLDPWWNPAMPAHRVGSAPAARRISAVAG